MNAQASHGDRQTGSSALGAVDALFYRIFDKVYLAQGTGIPANNPAVHCFSTEELQCEFESTASMSHAS